jgi:hypothetical protein
MAQQIPFGRRSATPLQPLEAGRRVLPRRATPATAEARADQPTPASANAPFALPDHELESWKKARRKSYRLPWRQLSWLASLFFGIGAWVLPDTVNDNVQWVLYALMAASFYAGFVARRAKSK